MDAYAASRLIQWVAGLLVAAVLIAVLVFSPFYARGILWILERYTPVEVDQIAARSQQRGQLKASGLEPGSPQWIAQQAYLTEVELAVSNRDDQRFAQIEQRYPLLVQQIENGQVSLDTADHAHQQQLFDQYRQFLHEPSTGKHVAVGLNAAQPQSSKTQSATPTQHNKATIGSTPRTSSVQLTDSSALQTGQPTAIVILGGGLRRQHGQLLPNDYTVKRLEQTLMLERLHPLPIVLSGVEAPYMQAWLQRQGVQAQFLESKSMNTCENTRFSALLLQKQGGAPMIFLVTDAYHMPRARKLFAQNGVTTVPVIAPLPQRPTTWQPSRQNWMHSRRANYELLAFLNNGLFGEDNCRETPS